MLRRAPGAGSPVEATSTRRRAGLVLFAAGFIALLLGPDLLGPRTQGCVETKSPARIAIVTPSEGQMLETGSVDLELRLAGGSIGDPKARANRSGEGQLHIIVDGQLSSVEGAERQTLDLSAGRHVVEVEYVANDHRPFCPRVSDQVSFLVLS